MDFKRWLETVEYAPESKGGEEYFGIGHGDYDEEEGFEPTYHVWAMIGGEIEVSPEYKEDEGQTHGSLWGHSITDKTFKGRFEPETKRLSVVLPPAAQFRGLPRPVERLLRAKFGEDVKMHVF